MNLVDLAWNVLSAYFTTLVLDFVNLAQTMLKEVCSKKDANVVKIRVFKVGRWTKLEQSGSQARLLQDMLAYLRRRKKKRFGIFKIDFPLAVCS